MRRRVSVTALRFALAAFFIVLGVEGVLPTIQESVFSLSDKNLELEIAFGVVEIICGVLLLLGLFTRKGSSTVRIASLLVFLLWLARIVFTKIVWGVAVSGGSIQFSPSFPSWIMVIAAELVIAAALLVVHRAYE